MIEFYATLTHLKKVNQRRENQLMSQHQGITHTGLRDEEHRISVKLRANAILIESSPELSPGELILRTLS